MSETFAAAFADAETRAHRSPWWLVLGSAMALIVGTGPVIQFSFAIFMKPLASGLHADRGALALAPALGLLLMGLVTPLLGWLTDRHGLRKVVPPCIIGAGLSFALLSTVQSLPAFIALYCLGSAFAAGYSPMPFAKAVSARFVNRRGLALGITMAGIGIGTALLPVASQIMIAAWGWRLAYVGLGALIILIALPATLATLPRNEARAAAPTLTATGLTARDAVRSGSFWALAVAFALVALATAGIMTHVVALLTDRGIAAKLAVSALGIGGMALIVGRLLSGYLLDRLFAPRVALLFFASALAGTLLLMASVGPMAAWLAIALIGLSLGAEVDLIAYLICRYLGQRAFGAIYGYLFATFTLGTALGPLGMGQSFARSGSYGLAMGIYAGGLAIACLLVARLGPYRYRADGTPAAPSA